MNTNLTIMIIGVAVGVFAIAYFIHELRWVNEQIRRRPWEYDEDEENE